jgi:hypothetical protein
MLGYIVIIALPVYFSIALISPKINSIAENQDKIVEGIQSIA